MTHERMEYVPAYKPHRPPCERLRITPNAQMEQYNIAHHGIEYPRSILFCIHANPMSWRFRHLPVNEQQTSVQSPAVIYMYMLDWNVSSVIETREWSMVRGALSTAHQFCTFHGMSRTCFQVFAVPDTAWLDFRNFENFGILNLFFQCLSTLKFTV